MLPKTLFTSKRNIKAYFFLLSMPVYFYHSLATKDYWTMLFISCLALYAPILWTALALFIAFKVINYVQQSSTGHIEIIQNVVVKSLVKNNLQDLELAIEANPEILYCEYQRKSLEAWCRYYKNTKAQELIVEMRKKYPKKSLAA